MQEMFSGALHTPWLPFSTIAIRMIAALVLGAAVGFERERRNRAAGLRTHMLVCLASASFAMLTIEIVYLPTFDDDVMRIDPVRLVEAVTGGVAFLAAGLIVFTNGRVRGLTTGAGMWLAGAIGLACGLGLLVHAGLVTLLAIIVLWALAHFESRLSRSGSGEAREAEASQDGSG